VETTPPTEPSLIADGSAPGEAAPPPAAAPPVRPPQKGSVFESLPMLAAGMALAIAAATWLLTSRQIDQLRRDVADLQEANHQLTQQAADTRKSSAVGKVIDVAGAPAKGPAGARVTLVEFSDYECPYCIRHFQQTMPQIQKNYIDTGKIRYVFRDFPIDQNHPQAIRAHEASRCALEQNKFWELHTRLFSAPGSHTPIALEDRAKEAGLDVAAFRACIASGRTTAPVRQTENIVESLGGTGTPWFFVGVRDPQTDRVRVVKPIGGAQPYEQFSAALDAALRDNPAQ